MTAKDKRFNEEREFVDETRVKLSNRDIAMEKIGEAYIALSFPK